MSEAANPNANPTAANPTAAKPDASKSKKPERSPKIRITSRVEGFRRAGVAHSIAPTDHDAGAFSLEQLAALQAEQNLIVELL
jgi:hypothetical protein